MSRLWPVLFLLPLLTGCLRIPLGYVPGGAPVRTVSEGCLGNATFSLDYFTEGDLTADDGISTEEELETMLNGLLVRSRAFTQVKRVSLAEKARCHLHFTVHYSNASRAGRAPARALMFWSLLLVPVWFTSDLDFSLTVYRDGKAVASPAVSESLRNYVWFLFFPGELIAPRRRVWSETERKCAQYLIDRIPGPDSGTPNTGSQANSIEKSISGLEKKLCRDILSRNTVFRLERGLSDGRPRSKK